MGGMGGILWPDTPAENFKASFLIETSLRLLLVLKVICKALFYSLGIYFVRT